MATMTLPARSQADKLDQFEKLFAAFKHAKATWDAALYAPDNVGKDLPEEQADALCEANCAALNAFLLHPVTDAREMLIKLRVFRDEGIAEGWWKAGEIVNQLVEDAKTLTFRGGRA
jgi:hypothetical protein